MNGLLDFLQGASNAAASNVSGPVDLIGMGLRKLGVPVPQNALLSSQWMEERGLTRKPKNALAAMAGETAGLLSPVVAAAKAPQIARGLLQVGENAAAPRTLHSQRGVLSTNVDDYVGGHRAPMKESGDPAYNVSKSVYPEDFYGQNGLRYYGTGDSAMDAESYYAISRLKDKPDRITTMYRAVPKEQTTAEQISKIEKQLQKYMSRRIVPPEFGGSKTSIGDEQGFYNWAKKELERLRSLPPDPKVPRPTINNGDWVTLSKAYAKQHGESALGGNYRILSKKVPARKLYTNGDSLHEFGYDESGRASLETLLALGLGAGGLMYAGQE